VSTCRKAGGEDPGGLGVQELPPGWLVPDPSGLPAQDGVLVPERQQFNVLDQVPAREQDREAEYPANQQVDDRERHPVSQPSPPPGRSGKRGSATESSIRAAQDISGFNRAFKAAYAITPRDLRRGPLTPPRTT
jgi:hypothetical protein